MDFGIYSSRVNFTGVNESRATGAVSFLDEVLWHISAFLLSTYLVCCSHQLSFFSCLSLPHSVSHGCSPCEAGSGIHLDGPDCSFYQFYCRMDEACLCVIRLTSHTVCVCMCVSQTSSACLPVIWADMLQEKISRRSCRSWMERFPVP